MKIGILSDTHGHTQRTRQAALQLKARGVETVIHCGDIGSQAVLIALIEVFAPPALPVHAVFGNVDHEDYVGGGIELHGRFADLELGGKRFAVVHGDDGGRLLAQLAAQCFDYLLTGHTHSREDRRAGRTRVINPGALQRTLHPGVAVLDTDTDTLEWIDI